MIEIKVNGEALDLPKDLTIRFEIPNTILDSDKIGGEYTFPFVLPLTATNKRLLGHVHRVSLAERPPLTVVAELSVMGTFNRRGSLYIQRVTDTSVQASLVIGSGNLGATIGTTPMRDMDLGTWGTAVSAGTAAIAQVISQMDDTVDNPYPDDKSNCVVHFPIYKFNHYDYADVLNSLPNPKNGIFKFVVNDFDTVGGSFLPGIYDDGSGSGFDWPDPMPAVWVQYLIDHLCGKIGCRAGGVFHTHSELSTLVFQGNYSLLKWMEAELPSQFRYDLPLAVRKCMPETLTAGDFLRGLRAMFNLAIVPSMNGTTIEFHLIKDIITSDPQADLTEFTDPAYSLEYESSESHRFHYDLDPNDSYNTDIRPLDGLNYTGEYSGVGALPATANNDIMINLRSTVWWRSNGYIWTPHGFIWNDHGSAGASQAHESKFGPINQQEVRKYRSADEWVLPITKTPGEFNNLNGYFKPEKEWTGWLLFYRGKTAGVDSTAATYPLGQSTNVDYNGTSTGDLTLSWYGESGLYENFWRPWIDLLGRARVVKRRVKMALDDIVALKFWERIRIDEVNYIILNISFEVAHLRVSMVELTLLST